MSPGAVAVYGTSPALPAGAIVTVLPGGATSLLPIFARDILHVGPEGLGLLRAAPAVGAVVVGLVLARRGVERHAGAWLLGGVWTLRVVLLWWRLFPALARRDRLRSD